MRRVDMNPFGNIGSLLVTIAVLIGLYYLVTGFFTLLSFITPGLLIGAAILNWRVFPDYASWIWKQLQSNILFGILAVLFTVVALPVVSGFLFFRAYFRYQRGKVSPQFEQRNDDDFIDFEEVEEMPSERLELPEIRETRQERGNSDYEQLFD